MELLAVAILWLTAAYLAGLGFVVLLKPDLARRFLSGFAQSIFANLLESGLRLVVGVAFVAAADQTQSPTAATVIGIFLAGSAVLMAMLPNLHRSFAAKSTSRIYRWFPMFGMASLGLTAILLWFIA